MAQGRIRLSEDFLDDMPEDIREPAVATFEVIGEPLVIESERGQHRRM